MDTSGSDYRMGHLSGRQPELDPDPPCDPAGARAADQAGDAATAAREKLLKLTTDCNPFPHLLIAADIECEEVDPGRDEDGRNWRGYFAVRLGFVVLANLTADDLLYEIKRRCAAIGESP